MLSRAHLPVLAALTALTLHCGSDEARTRPLPAPPPAMPPIAPAPQPALPAELAPLGRLPADVRPLHYTLALEIVPTRERFAGTVEIALELSRPRDVLWLHGRDLRPKLANVRVEGGGGVLQARYEQVDPSGVVAIRLPRAIGPGKATLHIDYDAPFNPRLDGLYRVVERGQSYAFTQFEAIAARRAFPCLDEPAFKTPFDVTVFAAKDDEVVANTHEIEHAAAPGGLKRVVFATTPPLPTYLVALAVGPLDIVNAAPVPPNASRRRALPLRGVATRGRGRELSYALEHTSEIVATLESYFGTEYPWDKLDIIAVPDKGGAMENPGALTFRETLLLLDPKNAPADQQQLFAAVMAHELAHQWFGDLVTMPWWDDIWLNEAFATWMSARAVKSWRPEYQSDVHELAREHEVMGFDSLLSARQIRQPIRDNNDIANAFDGITYVKGAGVIAMFERWMGVEPFQRGIRTYLDQRRFGNATADDLLAALSTAAQRDVGTPFRTFLDQPGIPVVDAKLECKSGASLSLKQSRYVPVGSAGDPNRIWQIPICARYPQGKAVKESCTLLTGREGTLPLEGGACPAWILPNADAAGYYRFSVPPADFTKLTSNAWPKLGTRERLAVADSLRAGFARGTTPAADAFAALAPMAADPNPAVATQPMHLLRTARDWLDGRERAAVEAYARKLYEPAYRELGWGPKKKKAKEGGDKSAAPAKKIDKGEDNVRALFRRDVLSFLAFTARDPAVRKQGAELGRELIGFGKDGAIHPEVVEPTVAGIALELAVEEGDRAVFEAVLKLFLESSDELLRGRLLGALAAARSPELAARALDLALDPRVKATEVMAPVDLQLEDPEMREAAWRWLGAHVDAVVARMTPGRAGWLPWAAQHFCDKPHAEELTRVFGPRMQALEGGPRNLAGATEAVTLCSARRDAQLASMREFFKKKAP